MRLKITKMFLKVEPQNGVEILRGSRVPASMFGSSIPILDFLMKISEKNSLTIRYSGSKVTLGPQGVKFWEKKCL